MLNVYAQIVSPNLTTTATVIEHREAVILALFLTSVYLAPPFSQSENSEHCIRSLYEGAKLSFVKFPSLV